MAKPSPVKSFLGSIEGLCLIEYVLRVALRPYKKLAGKMDADQMNSFWDLSAKYLIVEAACDRKLMTSLKSRREFEELKMVLEAGLTPAEVESTIEAHMVRKGWGSLDACRSMLFTYLTEEGLSADQAQEVIDNGLPKREARSRQLPVVHKIRKAYARMEESMAEAADALQEALSPSEGHDSDTGVETTQPSDGPLSDDDSDTEKK